MQIVIDIDEDLYKSIIGHRCKIIFQQRCDYEDLKNAIEDGIPLPKNHGRLIDADELYDGFIDGTEGYDCQTWSRIEIGDIIEDVPTIIEADKEESEG